MILRLIESAFVVLEGELGEDILPTKEQLLLQRARYALALGTVHRLAAEQLISAEERARLKDLILSDNETIVAALEGYERDGDNKEKLDILYRAFAQVPL